MKVQPVHFKYYHAKLRKRKNKYTIQVFKVESPPFTTCFGKSNLSWYGLPPPLKSFYTP